MQYHPFKAVLTGLVARFFGDDVNDTMDNLGADLGTAGDIAKTLPPGFPVIDEIRGVAATLKVAGGLISNRNTVVVPGLQALSASLEAVGRAMVSAPGAVGDVMSTAQSPYSNPTLDGL